MDWRGSRSFVMPCEKTSGWRLGTRRRERNRSPPLGFLFASCDRTRVYGQGLELARGSQRQMASEQAQRVRGAGIASLRLQELIEIGERLDQPLAESMMGIGKLLLRIAHRDIGIAAQAHPALPNSLGRRPNAIP